MNNNYSIDSVDIKNIIIMLGIEVFKFPLSRQSEDYKLRLIKEDYINHKLVTKTFQTDGIPSDDLMLNNDTNILRVYKKGKCDSIHCTGDSPIQTVAELYDYVICITIEIVELKRVFYQPFTQFLSFFLF